MNYTELSIENVKEKSRELYEKIIEEYKYDLVIFIAKGSYLIGQELSNLGDAPLLEIYATRKGGNLKKVLKPLIKIIPKKILINLRKKEMNSNYHEKNNDRQVAFNEEEYSKYKKCKKILLVDDSIDSGNSVTLVKEALSNYFSKAEIKVAVFNVMNKSAIKPEFTIYNNVMINGPWSNDSKYNSKHQKMYNEWKKNKEENLHKKKVSVAMATYNGKKYIQEQIDSILENLEKKDELIISDDGSNDGTIEIIKKNIKKDNRIKLINGPQRGVIKNFENALLNCNGDYIFLSDQDDIWLPNKVKTVMSYFEQDDKLIAIVHDAMVIDENNNVIMKSWFEHRNSKKGFLSNLIKNRYLGCCMAFDKRLLKYALPIPEDIEMHDWWLGLCAELKGRTKFINERLFMYRRHDNNVSSLNHYPLKKMIKNRYKLIYNILKNR